MEKAWETINAAMPDEVFNQAAHRRAAARRIQAALEVMAGLAGWKMSLREWYPQFATIDDVPPAACGDVANALEKEVLALQVMGPGAARGITLEDKLALYERALDEIRVRWRGETKRPVTWAAFKGMVASEVNRAAHEEEET